MNLPTASDYIDIHTHSPRNNCFCLRNIFAQELEAGLPDEIACSIGLHPWHLQQADTERCLQKIDEFAYLSQVLAIGETGLDRNIAIPLEIQQQVFLEHIRISELARKPMVIHCVKAYSDLIHLRKSEEWKMTWMFHWFNENLAIANELINLNCYLSFGRSLFHQNGRNAKVFSSLSLDKVFLETDDADLTIEDVYARAAELKCVSVKYLKEIINANFKKVFLNQ
jgi:TatD DNase family protein